MGTLIDNLHVEPDYRKLSVGTYLMHQAAKWIYENSKENGVYLEVYSENKRAREFYNRIGGIKTTEQPFVVDAVDGGKTLSYHMQWKSPEILFEKTKEKLKK
jgi:Acetyltransferases